MSQNNPSKLKVHDALKILAVSALVITAMAVPGFTIAYHAMAKEWRKYKRGDIGRLLKRLHQQQLIRLTEKDGQTIIELSEKGKNRLLKYDYSKLSLKKKRDGKLRIVIFDIPNKKKLARDMFRQKLKELGFSRVQESVFITVYVCKDEVEFIVDFLGIREHVMMFQIGKIEVGVYSFEFEPVYK